MPFLEDKKQIMVQRCCATTLLLVILWGGVPAGADYRPLSTTNRFPLHLLFLTPRPSSADLPDRGQWHATAALDYSSTFFEHDNSRWDVLMDMEMTVIDLSLTYGLTPRMALKLDVPLVSMNDGFLDGFLENYHDALSLPNYDRENRPKNTFGYQATKDGEFWFSGLSDSFEWADITLSVQFEWFGPRTGSTKASSFLCSLKLPTGDESRGYGSGRLDVGFYLPTRWTSAPWSFYVMPGIAIIQDPKTDGADVSARTSYSLFAGLGYAYKRQWTWLTQLNYYTSPIESTGLDELDKGSMEWSIGFQYLLRKGWIVEFAFCEDFTLAAPDFNVHLGVVMFFNQV